MELFIRRPRRDKLLISFINIRGIITISNEGVNIKANERNLKKR